MKWHVRRGAEERAARIHPEYPALFMDPVPLSKPDAFLANLAETLTGSDAWAQYYDPEILKVFMRSPKGRQE